jgi:hypothetical protein
MAGAVRRDEELLDIYQCSTGASCDYDGAQGTKQPTLTTTGRIGSKE